MKREHFSSSEKSIGTPVRVPEFPLPGEMAGEQWLDWINSAMPHEEIEGLRLNTSTGRPSGSKAFIEDLELRLDRLLNKRKPGRKPKLLTTTPRICLEVACD